MSLPRLFPIFDGPSPNKAPTGTPLSDASFDVTECSDAEFDTWLGHQVPNPYAQNPAFEHKRFNDDMLQIWMKLTTAATKAQVKLSLIHI